MDHCFITSIEAMDDASLPASDVVAASVFDTVVTSADLHGFVNRIKPTSNHPLAAYSAIRAYLGLAEDEKLYVGHLARIDFHRTDTRCPTMLDGGLATLIEHYLQAVFGLTLSSTPNVWMMPD